MNRHAVSGLVAAISLAGVLGCASSGTGGGTPAEEERVTPPRRVSQGAPPQLTIYSLPASGRSPIRVSYEVLIDAAGRPDMKTLKVSGPGAAENREALARWIESSVWAPASRGGQPVPHVYRGSLEARIGRR